MPLLCHLPAVWCEPGVFIGQSVPCLRKKELDMDQRGVGMSWQCQWPSPHLAKKRNPLAASVPPLASEVKSSFG